MSAQINTFELIEQIEKLAAVETAAIVATEDGAERRRGRLDMLTKLAEWATRGSPTPEPVADYGSGVSQVQAY